MIILEGPDNSGKSTLAQKIARLVCADVKHSVRPDPHSTVDQLLEHSRLQLEDAPIIRDRVYAISEFVYGSVIRKRPATGQKTVEMIRHLLSQPYLLIYCRPPVKEIMAPNGRQQMAGVRENHANLIRYYDTMFAQWKIHGTNLKILEYDFTDDKAFDKIAPEIEKYWKENHS